MATLIGTGRFEILCSAPHVQAVPKLTYLGSELCYERNTANFADPTLGTLPGITCAKHLHAVRVFAGTLSLWPTVHNRAPTCASSHSDKTPIVSESVRTPVMFSSLRPEGYDTLHTVGGEPAQEHWQQIVDERAHDAVASSLQDPAWYDPERPQHFRIHIKIDAPLDLPCNKHQHQCLQPH